MKTPPYNINLIITLLYLFIAATFTILFLGLDNISAKKIDWIFHGNDMTHHYVGWSFFKNDIWRFPFGSNPNYGLEIASSIIYGDSIPLLAIFFKLFKNYLPFNFQYFSIWIFLCFFLQGFISFYLIKKYTNNFLYSFIGSFFFIISPIFICRLGIHLALAGHWLILACFLVQASSSKKFRNINWNILILCSLLVHFYLAAMCVIIYGFFLIDEFIKEKSLKHFLLKIIFTTFIIFVVMYLFGYFMVPPVQTLGHGYGNLKMNLLGIFDPYQFKSQFTYNSWSYFLPDLPNPDGEQEGFSYIGLSGIILIIITLSLIFKDLILKKNFFLAIFKKNIIYFFIFLFFFLFSLSNNIDLGNYELLHFELNKYIYGLFSILRVSGRFFWPSYYLIFIFAIIFLYKNLSSKKSILVLFFLLSIQVIDFSPGFKTLLFSNKFKPKNVELKDPIWDKISKNNIILRTTYVTNNPPIFLPLSYYLAKNNIKTDIFWLSRYDRQKAANSRSSLYKNLNNGLLEEAYYVIGKDNHLLNLKELFKNKNIGFFYRDNFWIVSPNKKNQMNANDIIAFNEILYPKIQFNKLIEPSFKINSEYFGLGWTHNLSKKGLWTEGNISTILFEVEELGKKNISLEIEIYPNQLDLKNNLKFSLFINDNLNQNYDLNKDLGTKKIIVKLPESINNIYKVDFKLQNPVSALEKLISPDARKLGLLVKSIQLKSH